MEKVAEERHTLMKWKGNDLNCGESWFGSFWALGSDVGRRRCPHDTPPPSVAQEQGVFLRRAAECPYGVISLWGLFKRGSTRE